MITGSVNASLTPYVQFTVRGPLGEDRAILFLMDTGFSGQMSLPSYLIGKLSLLYTGVDEVVLADGTTLQVEMYEALVIWDGHERRVVVTTLEDEPLLGTELLHHHDLSIRFEDGGLVVIQNSP